MKNSIFKSYTKKILRSEAFISVIIVFVLALGIIGTSYALYMDVDKDTDYQLVEAGDLKISFSGSDTITLNMLPQEDAVATNLSDNIFTFNIYNTGTYNADYKIKLVATTGDNYVSSEYINYQLCKSACTDETPINTLNNITDSIIYTDIIKTTDTGHDYILRVWVNNTYPGTTEQSLQVKVVVETTNATGYLVDAILESAQKAKEENDTNRTQLYTLTDTLPTTPGNISGATEKVLGMAPDDYTNQIIDGGETGDYSYYYRGAVEDNYLEFNNMCWRIVRVEGDGSVKITLAAEKKCAEITESDTGSAEIGFIGFDQYQHFEAAMNKYIDWYNKNMSNVTNKIKSTKVCVGDVTTKYDMYGNKITDAESANHRYWYYEAAVRYFNKTPMLTCTENGISNNSYSISSLTLDEVVFAGGGLEANKNFYLVENTSFWVTLSEFGYDTYEMDPYNMYSLVTGSGYVGYDYGWSSFQARPAISLIPKMKLAKDSGDGTIKRPYKVIES